MGLQQSSYGVKALFGKSKKLLHSCKHVYLVKHQPHQMLKQPMMVHSVWLQWLSAPCVSWRIGISAFRQLIRRGLSRSIYLFSLRRIRFFSLL
jgi:hypothetical protein